MKWGHYGSFIDSRYGEAWGDGLQTRFEALMEWVCGKILDDIGRLFEVMNTLWLAMAFVLDFDMT